MEWLFAAQDGWDWDVGCERYVMGLYLNEVVKKNP